MSPGVVAAVDGTHLVGARHAAALDEHVVAVQVLERAGDADEALHNKA